MRTSWDANVDSRATVDLWLTIAITISLSAYHLLNILNPVVYYDAVRWMHGFLFAWILSLLWVAYRRWLGARHDQQQLRIVLSSISTEVIAVIDRSRRIKLINDAARHVFGLSAGDLIGRTTEHLYKDRREFPGVGSEVRETLERQGFHVGEATGIRTDGTTFPLEIATAVLRNQSGAVLLMKDITERKAAEAAILREKETAEAANVTKSKLLEQIQEQYHRLKELEALRDNLTHMLVHDLRTPLQVILSSQDILARYAKQPLHAEDLATLKEMTSQTYRMINMVNDILDVSRLESGQFPLDRKLHRVEELVREPAGACGALQAGVDIVVDPPAEEVMAWCDDRTISRVLTNLMGNAVKFSPTGSVVRVGWWKVPAAIRVCVKDSGPGISPEFHARIFEKFGQVSGATKNNVPSTGIGLTFCKLAVEAHGGRIGVESEVGKGSNFWFELPLG